MKKIVIILFAGFFAAVVILSTIAVIVSFTVVKPTTDTINRKVAQKFAGIVSIPPPLPPQTRNFYETIYFWEMETPQQEVVGVRFRHSTGFDGELNEMEATLELPENGDPSVFNKVLPAVVADSQSLLAALDPKKANFGPNPQAGYSTFRLAIKPETGQTIQITWNFEKEFLTGDAKQNYQKLSKFPLAILKILYLIQKTTLDVMGS